MKYKDISHTLELCAVVTVTQHIETSTFSAY